MGARILTEALPTVTRAEFDALHATVQALQEQLQGKLPKPHYSVNEAFTLLGRGRRAFNRGIEDGTIRTVPGPSGERLVTAEEVARLMREGFAKAKRARRTDAQIAAAPVTKATILRLVTAGLRRGAATP